MRALIKYLLQILQNQRELKALVLETQNASAAVDDTFLITEDVMQILQICKRKVWDLRDQKILPYTIVGKTVYFSKRAVYSLLKKND